MSPSQQILPVVGNMWAEDHASKALGMELVSVSPGRAELSMKVRSDMVNGHGICHGGIIFSLADSAFAFACNSHNLKAVASGARIEFLGPGRMGDRLSAVAEQASQGKRTGIYDAVVKNQKNDIIALFRGNAHRTGGKLVDDEPATATASSTAESPNAKGGVHT